jgi:hypothetical protein
MPFRTAASNIATTKNVNNNNNNNLKYYFGHIRGYVAVKGKKKNT